MSELTPLMAQYHRIKEKHKDIIVFFRLGDFYEMFGDDAKVASKILEITLTARQSVPMCGIPYHSAEKYISRLIKAGHRVAICEQVETPGKSKDIVKRDVIRIITPGTVLEDAILESTKSNYLSAIYFDRKSATTGIAFADITTGDFRVREIQGDKSAKAIESEISMLAVAEILLPESEKDALPVFLKRAGLPVNYSDDWNFAYENAVKTLLEQYGIKSLKGLGLDKSTSAVCAAGAIIKYIKENQLGAVSHLNFPKLLGKADYMALDESTVRNLELVANLSDGTKKSSLLGVIDSTVTNAGARLLRDILLHPLTDPARIMERQEQVSYFFANSITRAELRELLSKVFDLERIIGKLNCGTANARDLKALCVSLKNAGSIKEKFEKIVELKKIFSGRVRAHDEVTALIDASIVAEPPATIMDGGIINPSYDCELSELHSLTSGGKEWITKLQEEERAKTGIGSLKVGYTSVFGYYLEITKSNLKQAPEHYIRKQTLVNAERFITPELKEKEALILNAEEKRRNLEYAIFGKIRTAIMEHTASIQEAARALSELDVACAFAQTSAVNNYVKPILNTGNSIIIKDGRHPVVEKMLYGDTFVPNDTLLDENNNQVMIITGPNMAGKSTYIRQTAIIVLLAQTGCFVPAGEATIGIVDRIFTRIGTADNIAGGQSTFMVEMTEVANILNNATEKSLLILDEVGRGTSTFDGISIAWSVIEWITGRNFRERGPRTLFATHYFELTDLARTNGRVINYNFSVREWNDRIIFLRKIVEGSADKSYGIHVAKLAGIPGEVISRAEEILDNLEKNSYSDDGRPKIAENETESAQLTLFGANSPVINELMNTETDKLTPIEALNKLNELRNMLFLGKNARLAGKAEGGRRRTK